MQSSLWCSCLSCYAGSYTIASSFVPITSPSWYCTVPLQAWIVMEYCEAGTLDSLLSLPRLGRAFTETEAAAVMKMLLLGLQYMHDHKTIHRDVKGANVLVTARGECKLADFGLSRLLKNSVDKATSLEGSINKARTLCGTPLFVYVMRKRLMRLFPMNYPSQLTADPLPPLPPSLLPSLPCTAPPRYTHGRRTTTNVTFGRWVCSCTYS